MNIHDRLKQVREALNLTQVEMSEKIGLKSKSYLGVVESGKQFLSFDLLVKICDTFNISTDYLIYGVGSMFRQDNEFLSTIEPDWIEILKIITSSSDDMQLLFIEHMKHAIKLTIKARSEKKD
jgi:transcriptional regulator with XRE-family HTH domain